MEDSRQGEAAKTHYEDRHFKTSDGLSLNYRVYGPEDSSKPALIALPGLTRNVRDLDPMAAILADTYRIYTLNLRGRDISDFDENYHNYTTPVYIRDIYEFWQHINPGKAIVLGSSLGALLAFLLVEDHPDMLAGIVLNDLGATIEAEGMGRIFSYAGVLPDEEDIGAVVKTLKEHIGSQFQDISDEEVERMANSMYGFKDGKWHHRYDDNLGKALRENQEEVRDLWAIQKKIGETKLPILAIRGVLSDVTSLETINKMREIAPQMQNAEIPKRGHTPIMNEPECINALRKFLESF